MARFYRRSRRKQYAKNLNQHRYRVNDQIRIPEVKVVDDQGQMLGVMATPAALQLARDKGLDLVEVAPNTRPSIVRIMDYGKYSYRQQKMARKQRAHRSRGEIKGVRIGYRTSPHDMAVQAKKAEAFLEQGHKVKVELILRGRERAYNFRPFVEEKRQAFLDLFSTPVKVEQGVKKSPRGLTFIIGRGEGKMQPAGQSQPSALSEQRPSVGSHSAAKG